MFVLLIDHILSVFSYVCQIFLFAKWKYPSLSNYASTHWQGLQWWCLPEKQISWNTTIYHYQGHTDSVHSCVFWAALLCWQKSDTLLIYLFLVIVPFIHSFSKSFLSLYDVFASHCSKCTVTLRKMGTHNSTVRTFPGRRCNKSCIEL